MTGTTDSRRTTRNHAVTVATASLAMFVLVLAFLLIRLEAGRDPAIAVGEHAAPGTERRTLVLERRIVKTDSSDDLPSEASASSAESPSTAPAPTPTTRQS
jgi:hypothetical protein